MATTKITDLTAYTDPVNTDVLPIVDVTSDVTKKVSIANVMKNASLGTAAAPAISFDGDPNTGIYSPGADQVAVTTGGTQRLLIDSAGAVTIAGDLTVNGTTTNINTTNLVIEDKNIILGDVTTPTDVTADGGGITLKGTTDKTINWVDSTDAWTSSERFSYPLGSAAAPTLTFTGDANTGIYSPGADQVAISTNGTGRLFVDASGNINVGTSTSTPTATLQINGTTTFNTGGFATLPGARILTANDSPVLRFYRPSGGSPDSYIYQLGSDGSSFTVGYAQANRFNETTFTERLRLDSSGRLGLGTSSPSELFHLSTTSVSDATLIRLDGGAGLRQRFFPSSGTGKYNWQIAAQSNVDNGFEITPSTASGGSTFSTPAVVVKNDGKVGIGTTSPDGRLHVLQGTTPNIAQLYVGQGGGSNNYYDANNHFFRDGNLNSVITATSSTIQLFTGAAERARIDSSGRLLVGTSSSISSAVGFTPAIQAAGASALAAISVGRYSNDGNGPTLILQKSRNTTVGSQTIIADGDSIGRVDFEGSDGSVFRRGASIDASIDGSPSAGDLPTRLVFSTTADGASSPTERVRINSSGDVYLACQTSTTAFPGEGNTANGVMVQGSGGKTFFSTSSANALTVNRNTTDGNAIVLRRGGTEVGSISVTTTATAYNTSSDYRLKENVVSLTGAIDRINDLQVHRFNFISDPAKTVDGFIAHEAQAVVPECVTGTKDEVDADGNPVYQGIDQSKLVPLLTAALQEAIGRIETLEAEVAALKGA